MERIVVCLKPVPDPKQWDEVSMDPQTQTLIREGIPSVINPLDKHAIEAALSIRDVHGGEVVLLSMAPPSATSTLREGLAMGADRAVLLSDRAFAGSDTLATAHVLAAGCRWLGDVDLIICGNMSIDGSTAQVGSQLAELLDLPNVMHVIDLDLHDDGSLVVTRKIEHGLARLAGALPLVISVRKELNKPRYTSFIGILAAESKEIKILSNQDLKIPSAIIGIEGSPTQMAGIELRRFERKRERLDGSVEEIVESLAERIYQYGII
ncbi:MAG: electron transfer flavoprotein subunit beta/FixA family protein [Proteobacteria bacterium]|nr:electron transfer flavoprotein subunit beta/FixA family protein [Pseudomonadota bacterium]